MTLTAKNPLTGPVRVSEHAINRFRERFQAVFSNAPPTDERRLFKSFKKQFKSATPEDIGSHSVLRMLNSMGPDMRIEETKYLSTKAMRFVVVADCIVTVEPRERF